MRIQKIKKTKKTKNLKLKSLKTLGDGMIKIVNGSNKVTFEHFSGAKKNPSKNIFYYCFEKIHHTLPSMSDEITKV